MTVKYYFAVFQNAAYFMITYHLSYGLKFNLKDLAEWVYSLFFF